MRTAVRTFGCCVLFAAIEAAPCAGTEFEVVDRLSVAGPAVFSGTVTAASGITAASGTFTASGAGQYSVETASGIKVIAGGVAAPFFAGSGSALTGITASQVAASGVQAGVLGASVIASSVAAGAVDTVQLKDAGVTDAKIAGMSSSKLSGALPALNGSALTGISAVPSGMIAFFAAASCPSGWSEYTALRGRTLLGLPAGGTVAGTYATALGNLGTSAITNVPAHTHTYSATTDNPGGHTHDGSSLATGSAGTHDHNMHYNLSGPSGGSSWSYVGDNSYPTSNLPIDDAGAHTHPISGNTGSAGSHTHGVSGTTSNTGSASVDVTMPYIQLIACQAP